MKRLIRIVVCAVGAIAAALALSCVVYSCAARARLEAERQAAERVPGTPVIAGLEAVTLAGGTDRACLLVHGWIGARTDFNDLGERLQREGFTVRLMRLPGHGTSPRDLEEATAGDLMAAVRAEFDALQREYGEVSVVGFSMGGSLAALLAAERPVARLILIAPYFGVTYQWFYVLPPEWWNALLSPFVPYVIKTENMIRVNRAEARDRIFSYRVVPVEAVAMLFEIGRLAADPAVLQKVTCPVLMLHSRGDEAADPDAAEAAFRLLGSSAKQLLWFDRSNHHILWDHDAEAAARAITAAAGAAAAHSATPDGGASGARNENSGRDSRN